MPKTIKKRGTKRYPVYVAEDGTEIKVSPIHYGALMQLTTSNFGLREPMPPMVTHENSFGGVPIEDMNDPAYVVAKNDFDNRRTTIMLKRLLGAGVKSDPPSDNEAVEEYLEIFPDATPADLKFAWIMDIMEEDELGEFMDILMGQTAMTEGGVQDAEERFRDTRKRKTRNRAPIEDAEASGEDDESED